VESTTVRIDQKRFLRGRQTLILDGDMLKVEFRRGLSLNEYRFDLRGFLPDPVRIKRVPLARIVGASLLTVLGAVLLMAGVSGTLRVDAIPPAMIGGMILLIFAALVWYSVGRETVDIVLFQGPAGQFVLWPDHPNKAELQEFLTAVSTRILNAQHPDQDMVRQLRQAEIIDDWQYEQAMKLLGQKGAGGRMDGPGRDE
jgi:hypothetical protein